LASAKEIPPGGEGKIDVTVRTSTKGGKISKTITVTTNDPEHKETKLTLSTDVHVTLAVEPYLINFGRLKKGEAPVRYVSLVGDDKDKTKILSVEAKNKDITVETNPAGYENDKDKKIKIALAPTIKAGQFRDVITITTDNQAFKTITINIFGEIVGDILVTPRSFSFGFFQKSNAPEKIVSLKANPPATFKILKTESNSPDVTVETVTVAEGKEYQVKARVNQIFDKDYLRGNILITTDNKEQPRIEVMFFGRLQKPGQNLPGQPPQGVTPMQQAPGITPVPPGTPPQ
jgi:hypothetical protein